MESISVETRRCFDALQSALRAFEAHEIPSISSTDFEDQLGRLWIWSINASASAVGPTSLDSRLREAPTMKDSVRKLLNDLQANAREIVTVLNGDRPPYESREPESDGADDRSSTASDSTDSASIDAAPSELGYRYKDIVDIVDHLYKLSFKIRGPDSRTYPLKAAVFEARDPITDIDLYKAFEDYDRQYIREAIHFSRVETNASRAASKELEARFAKAVTLRRRQLGYWQRHRMKLERANEDFRTPKRLPRQPIKLLEGHPSIHPSVQTAPSTHLSQGPSARSKPMTILSGTEATAFLQVQAAAEGDTKSEISTATTALDRKGARVALPSAPSDGRNEFVCTLCFAMCPANTAREKAWRWVVASLTYSQLREDRLPNIIQISRLS